MHARVFNVSQTVSNDLIVINRVFIKIIFLNGKIVKILIIFIFEITSVELQNLNPATINALNISLVT